MKSIENFSEYNKISGVYGILNLKNGKLYIGSSVNIGSRLKTHLKSLREGKSKHVKLQKSFDLHGERNFSFNIVEIVNSEFLLSREQFYLDFHKSYLNDFGYNICQVAGSCLGRKDTKEQRDRKSAAIKLAYNNNPDYREKIRNSKIGEKNPQFGKKQSSEMIETRMKNIRGSTYSEERIDKVRNSLLGGKRTEEQKANMRKSRSELGRKNIAEAMIRQAKKIYQYDKEWNLIKEWSYSLDVQNELGILRTTVSFYARKNKILKGFYWSYNKLTA